MSQGPRVVHDVLDFSGPVAFNQVQKGAYQPICPWCASDVGGPVEATTYGDLYELLFDRIVPHVMNSQCRDALKMAVTIHRKED
jgi:hypothetical protein